MSQPSLEDQLEGLLSEPIISAMDRERNTFDELATPFNNSLVLFGAGGMGRKTLAELRQVGIEPLVFADNNASLWGYKVEGVSVFSPQAAAQQFADRAAVVVTIWRAGGNHRLEHTRQQLLALGCSKVVSFGPLFWKYADIFLPYYAIDLPHRLLPQADQIVRAFGLWADGASRREYLAQVRWRLQLDFDSLPSPVAHAQYFPDNVFSLSEDEVFVDCGAYDGDSLRVFVERQPSFRGSIFAIEPDPGNLKALKRYVATLPASWREQIKVFPWAVGARRESVRFSATGLASAGISSTGTLEIETLPLDDVLHNMRPTFIKMDIEGAEYDALLGARRSIENALPILAICVYHQPDHLWRIPLLIQSFSDQYRFFLRPYN
ncbi:MAG: FkbM family methyltransferase, partial [Chloroflexi bacterium]|nr:FkbM family methyltransferase [Chloroflexota bacterium]